MRLPLAVIAILLAVLVPLGFATGAGTAPAPVRAEPSASVATIAHRVETLRGLRFEKDPVPVRVTPEQATREGLADLDRAYPPAAQEADETLYTMLGLLPAGTDLRDTSASIFGEQVAGYYDPRTHRLRLVDGAATNRVVDEMVIAHELDHALEDQAIGIDLEAADRADDPGYAYKALVEGSATFLMTEYVAAHFGAEQALGGLLSSAFTSPPTGDLPPFILQGLLFPYDEGQRFVTDLYRRTDSWRLVDVALRDRPPVSTEQVMHPDKWLAAEQPQRVGVPSPGPGWRRLTTGTFGEWQTGQLLSLGGGAWAAAADGWGGDRYALYRRGGRDALVMRWTHDSPADGAEFADALRAYVEDGLGAQPARGRYRLDGRAVAIGAGAGGVRLAIAPTAALARRLSRA